MIEGEDSHEPRSRMVSELHNKFEDIHEPLILPMFSTNLLSEMRKPIRDTPSTSAEAMLCLQTTSVFSKSYDYRHLFLSESRQTVCVEGLVTSFG